MKTEPNKVFYAVAALAGTAAGGVALTVAAAVRRYRQRRAWKQVTAA